MMSGLTVATMLTIFFVPALYAASFKAQRRTQTTVDTEPVAGEPAPTS
jgi:multidrug efflux pump